MNKRVVITGMGAVSPNGMGNAAFAEAVLAGKSGVRRISRFDPAEIQVQIAGEVRDFDELAWVEKRERKHVSRVLPLALAAATEALQTAGIDTASLPLENEPALRRDSRIGRRRAGIHRRTIPAVFSSAIQQMSLFCVPTGVMGTLSSELSVRFGLRGPATWSPPGALLRPTALATRCGKFSRDGWTWC